MVAGKHVFLENWKCYRVNWRAGLDRGALPMKGALASMCSQGSLFPALGPFLGRSISGNPFCFTPCRRNRLISLHQSQAGSAVSGTTGSILEF